MDILTARRLGLGTQLLETPRPIFNVDGMKNKAGALTHYTELLVSQDDKRAIQRFYLTHLGEHRAVLGLPWLRTFNPLIDWANREMKGGTVEMTTVDKPHWARTYHLQVKGLQITKEQDLEEGDEVWVSLNRTTVAQEMAQKYSANQRAMEIPKQFQEFAKVFLEEEAKAFPLSREDDHAIRFKEGSNPTIKCKIYPMGHQSNKAIQDWTKDMLEKEFIRPSHSSISVPTFTVLKKDGTHRVVQDY
jgi:hypothetical protein